MSPLQLVPFEQCRLESQIFQRWDILEPVILSALHASLLCPVCSSATIALLDHEEEKRRQRWADFVFVPANLDAGSASPPPSLQACRGLDLQSELGPAAMASKRELGSGAFGDVTLHEEDGKSYALKTISHQLLKHRQLEAAAQVEREALEICQGHPCIVRFYGHVESVASTVLVMEVLQDLVGVYTSASLWGNPAVVREHVACVAEALSEVLHALQAGPRTCCWTPVAAASCVILDPRSFAVAVLIVLWAQRSTWPPRW